MRPDWIDADEVERLLDYDTCIEAMDHALRVFSAGDAVQPLRTVLRLPADRGALYVMPAWTPAPPALAVKLIAGIHDAPGGGPLHHGIVVVFDDATGAVRALVDAAPLTAIRTAAVRAVATRALARADASVLALLGTGVQARSHLRAVARVRSLERVRVWSRTPSHVEAFVGEHAELGIPVEAAADAEAAVRDADIICTVTSSAEPVLRGAWVAPGAHVNAVGASMPHTREIDGALVGRSRIFVDSIEAANTEAGDLLLARVEGVIEADDISSEIGAVLAGRSAGRQAADEITLFKSLGLAVEDAAAAALLLELRARG
jgi:alanine dehydrogenase